MGIEKSLADYKINTTALETGNYLPITVNCFIFTETKSKNISDREFFFSLTAEFCHFCTKQFPEYDLESPERMKTAPFHLQKERVNNKKMS